ncbi:MAG: cell division protein ZapA [Eubacteriales bacterium]
MSSKNQIEIKVGKRVITLKGDESEDKLHTIAEYLNQKLQEFSSLESYKTLDREMKQLLIQLNVAGDYFKVKEELDGLYDLKHELVDTKQELIDTKQELIEMTHKLTATNIKYQNLLDEVNELKKLKRNHNK